MQIHKCWSANVVHELRARSSRYLTLLAVVLLLPGGARTWAVIETYEFSAPELEQRYHQLSQELRCPKCQNQNIADSNAPISKDLRQLLYRQLEAGASDEAILEDMVSRYGEFVRYRPDTSGATLWLWLTPLLMLIAGALLLLRIMRRGDAVDDPLPSDAEKQRLAAVLKETGVES